MPSRPTVRWLPALLIIAAATTAITMQTDYWDSKQAKLIRPYLVFALPALGLMLALHLRPFWRRPAGWFISALVSRKCLPWAIITFIGVVVLGFLWVRSWIWDESISHARILAGYSCTFYMESRNSSLGMGCVALGSPPFFTNGTYRQDSSKGYPSPSFGRLTFRWALRPKQKHFALDVRLPYWLLICLFATPLLIIVCRRAYRSARDQTPRCRKCDYNLTGNLTGTCPECGSAVFIPSLNHDEVR